MGAEERTLRAIEMTRVVLERARYPGCQWTGWLRELRCGGCHGHRLFKWTDGAWCCTRCGHVGGGQSPPRALDGYGPSGPRGLQPDGEEAPPRRGPYSHGKTIGKILEAIPFDEWVSAAEIAAVVGVSPHMVGALIGSRLLGVYVERRRVSPRIGWTYFYRRLRRVDASRSIPYS